MRMPSKKWLLAIGIGSVLVLVITAVVVVLIVNASAAAGQSGHPDDYDPDYKMTLSPASNSVLQTYSNAAVSTDAVNCSDIANQLLEEGGTVADAAIGGLLCMGVVHSHSLGIGGGFLMVMYNATTKETRVLNAREMAPAFATEDMFEDVENGSTVGGLAVAVPGEIKGYWELHQRYGRLKWSRLFTDTIDLCENGFKVTKSAADALRGSSDYIKNEPSLGAIFINSTTGEVFQEGDTMTRPQLAKTFRYLAENGGNAFYTGDFAKNLIDDLKQFNGSMEVNDLENYRVEWGTPIELDLFGEWKFKSVPPPGSGVLVGFMLRVLGDILKPVYSTSEHASQYQKIIETFKYTYAKRSILGDPNDPEVTRAVEEVVALLKSPEYATEVRNKLLPSSTNQDPEYYGAEFSSLPNDHGTAHLSIIAENGDAISVTSTINLHFGAKIRSVQTGIIFNNEMDDFSSPNATNYYGVPPSVNNYIKPGKRPLSSMSPAIIVGPTGKARLVVGGAGGTKITTAVALVAMRNLWLGMNIKEAIDESRLHHQLFPMEAKTEEGFSSDIFDILKSFGHVMNANTTYSVSDSVVGAVERTMDGQLQANFDYRKSGSVAGY